MQRTGYGMPNGGYGASYYPGAGGFGPGAVDPCDPCPPGTQQPLAPTQQVEDYTGMPPTRLEDTDIYQNALNVSQAQVIDDPSLRGDCVPTNFQQRVVRRVELPYTRKVKVPTVTQKIVPAMTTQRVATKKLIQVPSFKTVDEEYTVFEEREAVREKEIWVKQIVPEKYVQRVPVKKVRQVQRPTTEVREVEEWVDVQVPTSRVVDVEGFRVDDVEDTKVVEVEELQEFEYVPQPTGQAQLARTREVGRVPGQHIARTQGAEVFHPSHPDLAQLDVDSNPDSFLAQQSAGSSAYGAQPTGSQSARSYGAAAPGDSYYRKNNSQFRPYGGPSDTFANATYTDPKFIRPAGDFLRTGLAAGRSSSGQDTRSAGLTVKNTHTRHTDGTGVLVTKVERGGPAALAGIISNDIITSVQGQPTLTVDAFRDALQIPGPLTLSVNRDGRRNVSITMYR